MSRRASSSSDSLDLLLDTICNTFGGVLFMAMLVVVLLNLSSEEQPNVVPSEAEKSKLDRSRSELAALRDEVDRMRRLTAEQALLAKRLSDPQFDKIAKQLSSDGMRLASMTGANLSELDQAAERQSRINEIAELAVKTAKALDEAKRQFVEVEKELQRERQIRTRTVALPKQRATTKIQLGFLLRGGKLHCCASRGPTGELQFTSNEARIVSAGGLKYWEPIPGAGTPVDPAGDKTGAAAARFQQWPAAKYFIAVVVWPDSFGHFAEVRRLLVEQGFEYQLMPIGEKELPQIVKQAGGMVQ